MPLTIREIEENIFEPSVFKIKLPSCKACAANLDFKFFELGGMEFIQWFCTNQGCNQVITIEIL